jgi:transposase
MMQSSLFQLCRGYRKLARAGKQPTVITAAIARGLTGFIWASAKQVPPRAN